MHYWSFLKRISSKKLYRYFYYVQYFFFLSSIITVAVVSLSLISGDHPHLFFPISSLAWIKKKKKTLLEIFSVLFSSLKEKKERKKKKRSIDEHSARGKILLVPWPWCWKQQRVEVARDVIIVTWARRCISRVGRPLCILRILGVA